jgi:hypothetical protein
VEGDDHGEAYTASMRGVGVSHVIDKVAGAETFSSVEGNMCGATNAVVERGQTRRAKYLRRSCEVVPSAERHFARGKNLASYRRNSGIIVASEPTDGTEPSSSAWTWWSLPLRMM